MFHIFQSVHKFLVLSFTMFSFPYCAICLKICLLVHLHIFEYRPLSLSGIYVFSMTFLHWEQVMARLTALMAVGYAVGPLVIPINWNAHSCINFDRTLSVVEQQHYVFLTLLLSPKTFWLCRTFMFWNKLVPSPFFSWWVFNHVHNLSNDILNNRLADFWGTLLETQLLPLWQLGCLPCLSLSLFSFYLKHAQHASRSLRGSMKQKKMRINIQERLLVLTILRYFITCLKSAGTSFWNPTHHSALCLFNHPDQPNLQQSCMYFVVLCHLGFWGVIKTIMTDCCAVNQDSVPCKQQILAVNFSIKSSDISLPDCRAGQPPSENLLASWSVDSAWIQCNCGKCHALCFL